MSEEHTIKINCSSGPQMDEVIHQLRAITHLLEKFMSKLGDQLGRITTGVDSLSTDLGEIKTLVQTLQTSPGPISPEDQATLDQLEAKVGGAKTTADGIVVPPAPTP